MADLYPIVAVNPAWIVNPEDMGTKQKFWYRKPRNKTKWLFKYPRPNTGEHWAEKIAAGVASAIGVRHAKVELATFQGTRGSVTESFVRDNRTLWHGNQMLEEAIAGYDPERRSRQSRHTLENIWKVVEKIFVDDLEGARKAKRTVVGYKVRDAWIGSTDRHHENWGVLRRREGSGRMGDMAPSFDHASSLGRELMDSRRKQLMEATRVGDYAKKGHGAIYGTRNESRSPSPLELVRRATRNYPEFFRPMATNLARMDEDAVSQIVHPIPSDWMSPSERTFAIALMRYHSEKLREILQ